MVIMLVMVCSILIAVMLERHGTDALTVQRQLDSYTFHHVSRGIQEGVEAWIKSNGTASITDALTQDGHAFDLDVDGGQTVHIYFQDAQGTVLTEFAGLSGVSLETAQEILYRLREQDGIRMADFVRREGPVAVSMQSASREVMTAVAAAVVDAPTAEAVVSEIIHAREEGLLDANTINEAFNRADVGPEQRPRLTALFTAQPVLWRVVAEADPPLGVYPPRPTIRYGGLAVIMATPGARDRSTSLQRNSAIISWENLGDR